MRRLAAEAQPVGGKVYRIGLLQGTPNTPALNYTEAVRQGLRDHGYVEGQNIVIEHRVSKTPKDNPALLADLLGRKIDILVTWTTPALVAAKKATSTIPIVGVSGDRSRRVWSRVWRGPAATSPASQSSPTNWN